MKNEQMEETFNMIVSYAKPPIIALAYLDSIGSLNLTLLKYRLWNTCIRKVRSMQNWNVHWYVFGYGLKIILAEQLS